MKFHNGFRGFRLVAVIWLLASWLSDGAIAQNQRDYRGTVRVKAGPEQEPAIQSAEFESGVQVYPPSHRSFAPRISLLQQDDWPASFSGTQADSKWWQEPDEQLHFEEFRSRTVRSRSVDYMRRRFYFISQAVRERSGNSGRVEISHALVYVQNRGDAPQTMLLQHLHVDSSEQELQFDIASYNGQLVLVYATSDGIFQRLGRLSGDGLQFFEPKRIHPDGKGVRSLQLKASLGGVHLLWTASKGQDHVTELKYMRAADPKSPKAGWQGERAISNTALTGSASLICQESRVYIGWCDESLVEGSTAPSRILIQCSSDNGESFLKPVLLSDEQDPSDSPSQALIYLAGENLVLLWRNESEPLTDGAWRMASIDRELTMVTIGETIANDAFRDAYNRRMKQSLKY